MFVPAGCTGKAQPADVVMQRPLKHQFSLQYSEWTTSQILAGMDAGISDQHLVEKRIAVLKPLVVQWMLESWKELKKRKEMLVRGWQRIGIHHAFDSERQIEAARKVMAKELKISDRHEGKIEEEEEDDEEDSFDRDENESDEEADMDTVIAACMEERPVVGTKRSARLAKKGDIMRDYRLAQSLHDSQLNAYIDLE